MYVDAAKYISHDDISLAVVNRQDDFIILSGRQLAPELGEEVAITLAMVASPKTKFVGRSPNRPY